MARRREYDDLPVSSYPSSLNDMMDSLLVWHDEQLVPASSASSQGDAQSIYFKAASRDAHSRSRAASASASEQSRPAGRLHVSDRAAPRVKDILSTPCSQASESQRLLESSCGAKGSEVLQRKTPTSTPGSAQFAPQSKLRQTTKARRPSQAKPFRRTRDGIESYGIENIPPPSGQMADFSAGFGLQDTNMNNVQSSQAFAFESDRKMDLMSIEDWEKENPYTPPPAKPWSPPPAGNVVPARLERNKGKDTQIFNTECQRRGLTHEFRFEEVVKGCFDVSLFVDGNFFDKAGPYASHRDAKEAMCRLALGKMGEMGFKNLGRKGNGKKRKSSESSSALISLPEGIEDENWIHIINSYAQANKVDYPDYNFEEVKPQMFTCTMGFPDSPLQAFGLAYGPFAKKETAKKVAAMEAVKWLRAEGKLSTSALKTQTSSKRRKSNASTLSGAPPNLAQGAMDTSDVSALDKPLAESAARQINELANALGLIQPQFHTIKGDGNFMDESATFAERDIRYEPRLAGVHGQVRRIFGKKRAHGECCRLVLSVLKEIQESRMV